MSNFLKLNWGDLGKGVLVAFLTVFVGSLSSALNAGTFPTLDQIYGWLLPALAAAGAYLLKNLFTNSDGQVAKPEQK